MKRTTASLTCSLISILALAACASGADDATDVTDVADRTALAGPDRDVGALAPATATRPAPPTAILAAVPDLGGTPATLTIVGTGFGATPTVRISDEGGEWIPLARLESTPTRVLVALPDLAPGAYRLELSASPHGVDTLDLALGAVGPQGPQGDVGPAGAEGPQGPRGDVGPVGPQGARGDVGPVGPQGARGDLGPVGPQGDLGPVGPQGPQGPQGDLGPVGPQGPQGPQGDLGPIGPQGTPGASGYQIVEVAQTVPAHQFGGWWPECPAGKRAVGGGVMPSGGGTEFHLNASAPIPGRPSMWYVGTFNGSGAPVPVTFYAVCLSVTSG